MSDDYKRTVDVTFSACAGAGRTMSKAHKYGAVATEVDGIRFASKKEAKRYGELKLLLRAGEITGLILQPRYGLHVVGNGAGNEPPGFEAQLGAYVADFTYYDVRARRVVVEDVKGFKTPLYLWKKKHAEAQYGIEIREI